MEITAFKVHERKHKALVEIIICRTVALKLTSGQNCPSRSQIMSKICFKNHKTQIITLRLDTQLNLVLKATIRQIIASGFFLEVKYLCH